MSQQGQQTLLMDLPLGGGLRGVPCAHAVREIASVNPEPGANAG